MSCLAMKECLTKLRVNCNVSDSVPKKQLMIDTQKK